MKEVQDNHYKLLVRNGTTSKENMFYPIPITFKSLEHQQQPKSF